MIRQTKALSPGKITALFVGCDAGFAADKFTDQYEILLQRFTEIRSLAYTQQVHGDHAIEIPAGLQKLHFAGEGDALFTKAAGTALLIRTADCVPILFYSETSGLIGAVHAGWRGLEKRILTQTLAATQENVASLRFVVGPFIRETSYEVGADVADRFGAQFRQPKENAKFLLNLKAVLNSEFEALKISGEQVIWHDTDTLTSIDWYSARKGDIRRNLALIYRV